MNLNKLFKIFFIVFTCIIVLSFGANAQTPELKVNTLSKVIIDDSFDGNFNVNLIFNEKFKGNAFVQNRQNGSYYVFIPDTKVKHKDLKVLYSDKNNKSKIKIHAQESTFLKDGIEAPYIKLSVDITGNYTIQLYSKTVEEQGVLPSSFNAMSFIMTLLFIAALVLFLNVFIIAKRNQYKVSRTIYPSRKPAIPVETKPQTYETITQEKPVLNKINIRKALKQTDNGSFSCFDVPVAPQPQAQPAKYDFKNTITKTAAAIKEQTEKAKTTTNPIYASYLDEAAELDLPAAEDLIKIEQPAEQKNDAPELLSELRITPTKGFYLTTVDETFALFGFVGANIFLLKKFKDLSQINLQARFYDRQKNSDLYILRLDSYKAMIEISETGMKELAVL